MIEVAHQAQIQMLTTQLQKHNAENLQTLLQSIFTLSSPTLN